MRDSDQKVCLDVTFESCLLPPIQSRCQARILTLTSAATSFSCRFCNFVMQWFYASRSFQPAEKCQTLATPCSFAVYFPSQHQVFQLSFLL